jgi:hypothetical protein
MARLRSWITFALSTWIILISLVFCSSPARAGIGFQPISQEELKMTSEPKAPGAPAVILLRQVDRDDSNRDLHEENYFRIKILNEKGREFANVEIPVLDYGWNVSDIKARTIRPDGSVVNFDGKVFEKTIVKTRDVNYKAKTFTLPEVQPGGIIEYSYTISSNNVYNSRWIISNELFTKKAKFSLRPYRSNGRDVGLRWIWQGVTTPPKSGPDHVIRMEVADVPAFLTEDHMPPENELKSRVDFIYSDDFLEKDQANFWKKAGKRINGNVESFIGKRKAMEQAVSEIVSPNDSPEEKARKIYARVQKLRNTSYEVHRTEQEKKRDSEKELSNVEDVWKRGYGAGAQLTWLYLALVRAAGLDASGVMVSERRNYFFNRERMDANTLDTNVVLLRLKDQDVFCDPGSAFTPFGQLPWSETYVTGLRLDKDGGRWIETPLPGNDLSQIERKANLKLMEETGALEGKVVVTYTGLEATSRRVDQRHEDEVARKKFLEDEVKESIPVVSEVELVSKPDWTSAGQPLVAEFTLKVPGWAMAAGRRTMLAVGLFSAAEKNVFEHAERTYSIYYQYPSTKLDDVMIEMPEGWHVTSLPPETNQDFKLVAYISKVENDKGRLHLSRKLSTNIVLLDTKYYSSLQNFYRMVRTNDEEQIVLLPSAANASK